MQFRRDKPDAPQQERRLSPSQSARARLRWLRSLIMRPWRMYWRRGKLRLVWVERRSQAPTRDAAHLHAELRAALAQPSHRTEALRELALVDEQLGLGDWVTVATLSSRVLAKASLQADRLAESVPSWALEELIHRLNQLQARAAERENAADARTVPMPLDQPSTWGDSSLEVSELSEDDYARAEQIWVDSLGGETASDLPDRFEREPKPDHKLRA